jgi:hypothetical protein
MSHKHYRFVGLGLLVLALSFAADSRAWGQAPTPEQGSSNAADDLANALDEVSAHDNTTKAVAVLTQLNNGVTGQDLADTIRNENANRPAGSFPVPSVALAATAIASSASAADG